MARETFISYKYSDVVEGKENNNLRDRIIRKLGEDAKFYNGERKYSKDLTGYAASTIKDYLKNMIKGTTVTIVILSPNVNFSAWVDWEIQYSLREIPFNDYTSHTNGIIAVVQKNPSYYGDSGYNWMKNWNGSWNLSLCPRLIRENQNNKKSNTYFNLSPNYIDIVEEEKFLRNIDEYIEDAYDKSQNIGSYYITKSNFR